MAATIAGREALIGQSVRVNGLLATVVGIMPERLRFPTNAEGWLPLAQLPGLFDRNRNARNLSVMGWLSDGYTVHSADDELRAFAGRLQQQFPDTNRGFVSRQCRSTTSTLGSDATGMDCFHHRWRVGVLIACANVANLMLMRSISRTREMAVRVSLGATRSRIVRQLLGESLVLAIVGGATGLALAFAWTRALTMLMPRDTLPYWMLPTIDGRVLVTVAAVCVSTTIVFGLVPALHASNTRPSGVLKEGGRSTGQESGREG